VSGRRQLSGLGDLRRPRRHNLRRQRPRVLSRRHGRPRHHVV